MYESLVVFSEFILSAYPILIKKVNASIFLQMGFRMFVFTVLAGVAAAVTGHPVIGSFSEIMGTGVLNLAHVGSSYSAFEALPAGNAMAIFYTYPVWNAIAVVFAFQESIPTRNWIWIGIALLGVLLVAQPSTQSWNTWGVSMALLAALTETGIYLWFRRKEKASSQPWTDMTTMYGGSGLLWICLIPFFLTKGFGIFQTSSSAVFSMVAFNALIGFVGYALRFFTIPNISTAIFSSLSFVGVIAAYLLGWFFIGETPSLIQALGALLIVGANVILMKKD
jgi:drug/metabolite transporter (DMT)-like permease